MDWKLQTCQGNFGKTQGSGKSRFGGSEKDRYFSKTPKWQHKHVRDYKRRKLVSYFLNNAAKTCLYGLKISENIEVEHVFQSKAFFFFYLSSNLHGSCLSAFNEWNQWLTIMKMRMKMINSSHRHDINNTRPRHSYEYTKHKMCLCMVMVMCNKQHLSNIWSWIYEKKWTTWGCELKETVAYKKTYVSVDTMTTLHSCTLHNLFW